MLTLKNISKAYPQRGAVLDNLNLIVKQGDTIAVTGPSGSGKTTLLNMIGLLDIPDSGSILFGTQELTTCNADESAGFRRDNVGFVFQDHLLMPYLTIIENIYLPRLAHGNSKPDIESQNNYINTLLEQTGISKIRNKFPSQVSGGEAQRATVVRALVNKPGLLLADEPTGSLDKKNADELGGLLKEINKELKTTIIAVTHSSELARTLERNFRLENGQLK